MRSYDNPKGNKVENVVTDSLGNEVNSKNFFAVAAVITVASAATFAYFVKKKNQKNETLPISVVK